MTEEIEDCIIRRASVSEIRAAARRGGMRTLREAGWRLVAAGDTSVAEVLEHTVADAEEQEPVPAATLQGRVHV
jgi:type II secretory ATPase GspE/PulE/Tfp pilus assembly ATPase PilB-like protein